MTRRNFSRIPIVVFVACGIVLAAWSAAHAGVYLYRDESSNRVVLSDVPTSPGAARLIGDPKEEESIQQFVPDRERVALYAGLIRQYARTYNLPEPLVKAIIQAESAFNPTAVSSKGAVGLMQVMPSTAKSIGIAGDLRDPNVNMDAGCRYLAMMLSRFKGQMPLALAAYNAGPENVEQAGNKIPDFPETKSYVATVMETMSRFSNKGSVYVVEISQGRFLLTNY